MGLTAASSNRANVDEVWQPGLDIRCSERTVVSSASASSSPRRQHFLEVLQIGERHGEAVVEVVARAGALASAPYAMRRSAASFATRTSTNARWLRVAAASRRLSSDIPVGFTTKSSVPALECLGVAGFVIVAGHHHDVHRGSRTTLSASG